MVEEKPLKQKILTLTFMFAVMVFVSAFLFSFEKIQDPDAWIHLSMGRLIVSEHGLPDTEQFVYPQFGQAFSYSSWLFGTLTFLIQNFFGGVGLVVFKALVVAAVLTLVFLDSIRPYRYHLLGVLAVVVILVFAHERFSLRPQIFSMLFLVSSIFCLNAFLYNGNKKYLYALPLIHLLWANSHSSINLMFVPFGAFLVGGWLQGVLRKRNWGSEHAPDREQLLTVLKFFVLSVVFALISPYFTDQFLFASQFLKSSWYKDHIDELLPPSGARLISIYIIDSVVLLSFLFNYRKIQLTHLLLILPFLYLPFVAVRFFHFCTLIGAPIAARNLGGFISSLKFSSPVNRTTSTATTVVLSAVLLASPPTLSAMKVKPFWLMDRVFGAGFELKTTPQGAVSYLDRNNIYGRIMNDFRFGQYIIWTGYPYRTVFIDGRGKIPIDLLEKHQTYRYAPGILKEFQSTYGFEVIVMKYMDDDLAIQYNDFFFQDPAWALVYWDDIAMVYLRNGGKYQSLINRHAYRYVKPDMHVQFFYEKAISHESYEKNLPLINELKRNYLETGSKRAEVFLQVLDERMEMEAKPHFEKGIKAYDARDIGTAHNELQRGLEIYPKHSKALSSLGFILFGIGKDSEAFESFRKALLYDSNNAEAYYGLGMMERGKGNFFQGEKHMRKYLELDPGGAFAGRAREALRLSQPTDGQ